jgi:PAS domain S-box-containing protein
MPRTVKEMESRYKALESSLAEPCVAYDLAGNVLSVNGRFEKAFGWGREELLGRSLPYVPADQQQASLESILAALAGRPFALRGERFTKQGRRVNVIITRARFLNAAGRPSGHVALVQQLGGLDKATMLLPSSSIGSESQLNCVACTVHSRQEVEDFQASKAKQAVKLLIELVQAHKLELQDRVASSLTSSVLPLISYLRDSGLSPSQRYLVDTLDFVLAHMATSFGAGNALWEKRLSPREAQICSLILTGQDTRTIAQTLGLTYHTVIVHRKNIRKKLGLNKNKQNLESYIRQHMLRDV